MGVDIRAAASYVACVIRTNTHCRFLYVVTLPGLVIYALPRVCLTLVDLEQYLYQEGREDELDDEAARALAQSVITRLQSHVSPEASVTYDEGKRQVSRVVAVGDRRFTVHP